MDLYNFFKGFLGLPNSVPPEDFNNERYNDCGQEGYDNLFRPEEEDSDHMGFQIFTNPLEMHRYFEQQMNEVMRAFGIPSDGSFFGDLFGGNNPSLEAPHQPANLRDQYLKAGYESSPHKERADSDIDGKVNMKELDAILSPEQKMTPYRRPSQTQTRLFGQSVSTRTILKPDGAVETHRTVRDSAGNEETQVTHKKGDQEYTIITKIGADGQQTKEEKLINIDEKDVDRFVPKPSLMQDGNVSPVEPPGWLNFGRYFTF